VLFNQNVLRILKDSILISEVSAEVTSFTKVYCVTPMAAIFVIIYAKLVNHLPFQKIFYYLAAVFTAFFAIFAFTIYPNIDAFHMDQNLLSSLMADYPHLKWYIAGAGNWSYVLFYTLSELWPNIFYVLLFWQIANEITTTGEAKRFYTLFSFFGNSSLIAVGFLMTYLSSDPKVVQQLFTVSDNKVILIQISIAMVTISSILSCLLIRYITTNIVNDRNSNQPKGWQMKKPKMGMIESFKYITRSKYLWLMLVCSASFGLSMNLVEAVWKAKIKELYPTVTEYAAYNSMYILWTGVAIMVMTVIGNNVIRSSSWFVAAIISPLIIFVTGTIFFILVVFDDNIVSFFDGVIIMSPLVLAVFIGAVQNVLSKGSKYSIWDTSIQMLYIPLDQELRTKGKSAVDVISPKIGKSASGFIQSIIFTIVPIATYHSIAPGLMIIFISICILWIYTIRKIYLEYQKIV
jgi:AAA family ATP:ADP antiporter